MKKIQTLLAGIALIGISVQAQTLENVLLNEGTMEARLDGFYNNSGPTGSELSLDVGFGYFFYDYIEGGVDLSMVDSDGGTTLGLGLFAENNFDTLTNWIPFVGGRLSYLNLDGDIRGSATGLELMAYGGTKIFLTEYLALAGTVDFSIATDDVYIDDLDTTNNRLRVRFGIRSFF